MVFVFSIGDILREIAKYPDIFLESVVVLEG
jgi:hypothetical protein